MKHKFHFCLKPARTLQKKHISYLINNQKFGAIYLLVKCLKQEMYKYRLVILYDLTIDIITVAV